MGEALVVGVFGGLLVALLGNLALDLTRGVPQRIVGRLDRLLQGIAEEEARDRWREELQGVLLEFQGRPLKQHRAGGEVVRAAEELVEVYRQPRRQNQRRISSAVVAASDQAVSDFHSGVGPRIDLRRDFLRVASEFLTYRELRVLECRHGLGGQPPESVVEVSRKFNVVPWRIEEIESEAIMKLESVAEAQKPREVPPVRH
jgi:hypothetical protein